MNYKISLLNNETIIACKVIGPMTKDTAVQFSRDMDVLSREKNIKRFLIDVRGAPNVSDALENFRFANEDMTELGLQKNVRCAIMVDEDDGTHNFVETLIRNAGYNVRIYSNEKKAMLWLEEKSLVKWVINSARKRYSFFISY